MAKPRRLLLLVVACLSLFPMSVPALISRAALRKSRFHSNALLLTRRSSSSRTRTSTSSTSSTNYSSKRAQEEEEEEVQQSQQSSQRRLEYVHGYHAGNYADVVKHSVLILLLEHMTKKKSPFCYVDTHAGAGSYPLDSRESSQLNEFQQGIGRLLLMQHDNDDEPFDDPVRTLVQMTKSNNNSSSSAAVYPGSPMIAKTLCRSQDTLLLFEKARDQFDLLRNNMNDDNDASSSSSDIRNDNGYKGLADYAEYTTNLPRALVFCDPPYQYGSDTDQIVPLVHHLQYHWKSARVALWYPASADLQEKSNRLLALLKTKKAEADDGGDKNEMLAFEMYSRNAGVGTGMVLVNPPYGIETELRRVLPQIAKLLVGGEDEEQPTTMRMKWL
mmetsp:Transcript_20498/g.33981  ORF Transcript_20498/g.33981 Transcript_20498/m.33981 type:complete len:387 (+) Transcript_20498:71-1231(+)